MVNNWRIDEWCLCPFGLKKYIGQCIVSGVLGREVERRPRNLKVPSSRADVNFGNLSLAHTFGARTGVVPRKQNRERLM